MPDAGPLTVGVEKQSRHTDRNTRAPTPGVASVFLPGWLPRGPELFGTRSAALRNAVYVPRHVRAQVDLMHLWNRVSYGRRPWGVTYESTLPRGALPAAVRTRLLSRLASPECRFVIAMSDQAVRRFARALPDEMREAIAGKVARVYPWQAPRRSVRAPVAPHESAPLQLLFVGKAFFRKGGEAILRVAQRVGDELNLSITIVSQLEGADYATQCLDDEHIASIRRRVADHPRINWHTSVANADVYRLAGASHIGLLPTLADTFGYSVLEFLSCGLPVVTSNVEATTEIVDRQVGWTIELPLGADGRWVGLDPVTLDQRAAYHDAIETLAHRLTTILRSVRAQPESIGRRSLAALHRIEARFGSERADDLIDVYARTCPDLVAGTGLVHSAMRPVRPVG